MPKSKPNTVAMLREMGASKYTVAYNYFPIRPRRERGDPGRIQPAVRENQGMLRRGLCPLGGRGYRPPMTTRVDWFCEPTSPPRGRKTTYEAGVCEAMRGTGFVAFAQYEAPKEGFYIHRRGRTKKAALKALQRIATDRWIESRTEMAEHLRKLLDEIGKEMARS